MAQETPKAIRRYRYADLVEFATDLLTTVGMDGDKARVMAEKVVEADLLGHSTHGMLFFPAYLSRIEGGHIAKSGSLTTLNDHVGGFAWEAHCLSGAWVMEQATQEILRRIELQGTVTATLANCSHIGCLQAYLMPFVSRGYMVVLAANNPGIRSVAPFGGVDPVITSNPIAYGIPSRMTPILIDYSTSLASNAFFRNFAARGEKLPGQWVLDAQGNPSDDAEVLNAKPPGSILPLGGVDFGYKGFGVGLFVEAASLALSGCGRKKAPDMFRQGVFLQVINPAYFAGADDFLDEMDFLVASCKASRPRPGTSGVRIPGERALQFRQKQLESGVEISLEAHDRLSEWLTKLGKQWPAFI